MGVALVCAAQNPAIPAKPDQHVLGTVTSIDPVSQTISVNQDKSGTAYRVSLAKTRTLLKVEPGAKDLKNAARITASDLAVGDRVDIRGFKADDNPNSIAAASVILMSARALQQARQAEMADWRQRGIAGTVTSVDAAGSKLNLDARTAEGPKPVVVDASAKTQFTRYSPESPKAPVVSQLSDIQPGDQVRVLGTKDADGSTITAEKIYSGAFRTLAGTIGSLSPGNEEITINDLRTKQPVQVTLTPDSAIRRLPPQMAAMLARRSAQPSGTPPPAAHGDISQIIERLPTIGRSDLKSGDAVIVSGATSADHSRLIATNVIAGVEALFQSAGSRQGRSPGGDWNLDMAIPAQ
jgi:hypothetical protein